LVLLAFTYGPDQGSATA